MAGRYYPGSGVRVTFTFRNLDGALTDPSSISVEHINPAGTPDTLVPVQLSVGVWYVDYVFLATDVETNVFRVVATGAVVDADKLSVRVYPF